MDAKPPKLQNGNCGGFASISLQDNDIPLPREHPQKYRKQNSG